MKKVNLICIAVVLGLCLVASQSWAQDQHIVPSKLDSLLDKLSSNNKFMGCVTIRKNDQILFNKAYGSAFISGKKNTRSTTETKYRIGSISKMFTSTMIFQLIEEQKLSLDAKLATFFPEIPNAKTITISNLLNHRTGIHNVTNDSTYGIWHTEYQTQTAMLDRMKNYGSDFEPNEKAEYSNSNFILLGYIIEKITGKDYATNLNVRITNKIGLKNTYFGGKTNVASKESFSYSREDDNWNQEPPTDMSVPGGAGAIVSTTNDLTRFITALFNGKLISKNSLDSMTTITEGYGRGIFVIPFGVRKSLGHNGGIDKFVSVVSYFPDDSVAFAFCSNGLDYNMNNIIIGILKSFYNKPYEIPSLEEASIDQEILKKYEGVYSSKELPMKITIKIKHKKLTAQGSGQPAFSLDSKSNTEFRFDQAGVIMKFDLVKNEMVFKQGGHEITMTKE